MDENFYKHIAFQINQKDLYNGDLDILIPQIPKECENLNVEVIISSIPAKKKEPQKEKLPRRNRQYRNYVKAVRRAKGH